MGCIRVLSESEAQLPLHLYQRSGSKISKVTQHNAVYLLETGKPNNIQNPFEFRDLMMNKTVLNGNFYGLVTRGSKGSIEGITPISNDAITPFVYTPDKQSSFDKFLPGGRIGYLFQSPISGQQNLIGTDLMHVRGMSINGFVGLSPISYQRETIGLALLARKHGKKFLFKGAKPSLVVKHPGELGEEGKNNLRESIEHAYGGIDNVGNVMVLEEGADVVPAQITNKDAQYLESRQFSKNEICAMFRVPPHMVADLTRATFSNIEHQSLDFVVHSLGPWNRRIEAVFNLCLLSESERSRGMFFDHNEKGLLRGDNAARSQYYQSGITSGWLTRNEAREMENLNPIDGADELLAPLNMTASGKDDTAGDAGEG